MADEPSLPRLAAASWKEMPLSLSRKPGKRAWDFAISKYPAAESSDPAIFSSDDDPGLDNYTDGRRKKRYVGSWFQQHPQSSDSTFGEDAVAMPKKSERRLARQADSGIFLGSDDTEGEDLLEAMRGSSRAKLPQLEKKPNATVSDAELAARQKIRMCLETGNEVVDFWSLGLCQLSNATIWPLADFSCIPVVTKDVAFEQREPELKVYLAMNHLPRLPGALFDLTHLTVLSLRGNMLTELSPAIAKLDRLKQLNVSQNRLRCLPAELLSLLKTGGSLDELIIHPNPFYQPEVPFGPRLLRDDDTFIKEIPGQSRCFLTRRLGRSPVQISDSRGKIGSVFRLPIDGESLKVAVADPAGDDSEKPISPAAWESFQTCDGTVQTERVMPCAVPSLMETSLRSLYFSTQPTDLRHYFPDDLCHLEKLVERVMRLKEDGGLRCSRCRRSLVMPTTEWVEWHQLSTCEASGGDEPGQWTIRDLSMAADELAVPFIYRGCTRRCGPLD